MRIPSRVNLPGISSPNGHTYADPKPSPDETAFQVDNTSAAYYKSPYYLAHKSQVQPIPPPRVSLPYTDQHLDLTDFVPQELIAAIKTAGQISFHSEIPARPR